MIPFGSFKVKTGLLVGGAITLASFTFWIGASWQFRYALLAALATSLVFTQFVAHGMTSPLRQMTAAARAMARGDYSIRVRATSRDEIGQLATAFNQMSADLGAADEYRRGLIANVSHELRTPIAALRAVLENVVDGVAEPDAETMRIALSQTERLGELVTNLLDLSRVEGGAIPLQISRFGVDEFLRDAIEHVTIGPGDARVAVRVMPPTLVAVGGPGSSAPGGHQPGEQRHSAQPAEAATSRYSRLLPNRPVCAWRCSITAPGSRPPSGNGSFSVSPAVPPPKVAPDWA